MRKIITLVALTIATAAQAQTGARVTGAVKDAEGKPLAAATVSLLRAKDSSLAKLAVTDKNGQYEFTGIKDGRYLVSFTSVGFDRSFAPAFDATGSFDVPAVTLHRAAKEMSGVTVAVRKPLVEARLDKMVVNVDASPTNAGSSALDVLEKSPGITLDKDGNVSLKGKSGIIVLVDGKQTYLSGQDLTNLLRNMPASQLDQIEIMTQPSAKYDASGNSGVLNLRTKKGLQTGLNGSINLSFVQARYAKAPQSFNLNYRKGKVNLFTSLSYSYWEGFNELQIDRRFPGKYFQQNSYPHFSNNNYSARVGLDYNISKKTSIGFMVTGTTRPGQSTVNSETIITDDNGTLINTNEAFGSNKDTWKNIGANLNFRRQLKKQGAEITADADYVRYRSTSDQVLDNRYYNGTKQLDGDPYYLTALLKQNIDIYSAKTDFVTPVGNKGGKLEAGLKSSYVKTDNDAPYKSRDYLTGVDTIDQRSDHFVYEENINAAYANWSQQLKKWSYQVGLRFEHTHSIGNSIAMNSRVERDYAQLFPTGYVSYKVNDKNTVGVSYSRRLERPGYQDLNPFERMLDRFTFQKGNPFLTPQFSNNIEVSHNFRGVVNTVFNWSKTTDIINDLLKQNDAEQKTFQTKENLASRRNIGLAVSVNVPVKKWWFLNVYVNAYNNQFNGFINGKPLDVNMTAWMANMSQQFRLNKGWTLETSGFYRSKTQDAGIIVANPMGVVSFGVSKSILKNMGTIKVNLNDPFWIQKFSGYTKFDNVDAVIRSKWDNRRVGITFTWRFAKGQSAPQQRRRTSAAQDEQNRVGGGGQQ
ncbi:TonB-dependent receptor [Flaviaesturariibacter flavus]|uniref:TonB-dependent receptor n=1 Tax=Flaviaesturariibacter flavus TaxID=2502780 RepID=A0A4R1BPZ8_9BACT|nr:TonB dependent receptor [Flaviaesturariibacter flavus]TCJ19305.1 TonB-dependent receptor [Flaviaesturariibacter flavus]